MRAFGIDYSMTCPAICYYTPDDCEFWYAHDSKLPPLAGITTFRITETEVVPRAIALADDAINWILDMTGADECAIEIEDYAYNATGQVFHIGENTGILKARLLDDGLTVHPVSPSAIKKFATGKGNADKPKMVDAFLAAFPAAHDWIVPFFPRWKPGAPNAKSPLADLADAYWIAKHAFDNRVLIS